MPAEKTVSDGRYGGRVWLTLVVVELVGVVAVQQPQQLDDIGVRLRTGEGVSSAIETKDQLPRRLSLSRLSLHSSPATCEGIAFGAGKRRRRRAD